MDGQRFDQLTKALAAGATRRRLIKGIAGGAVGALAGVFGTKRAETVLAAPLCPGGGGPDNKICHCPPGQDGGNCQTTGNGGGHEGTGHEFDCCCLSGGAPNPLCICPTATTNCCKPAGTSCSSNAHCCADAPNCCQGVCQAAPCSKCIGVTCTALDQCHDVGVCDPATGICSNPPKADGSACNDNNACTQTDTCVAGVCTGSNPVVCPTPDQCHDPGTCNPATGVCSNPPKADGTPCDDGLFCTATDTCQGGVCTGSGSPCDPLACLTCDEGTDTCLNTCPVGTKCDGNGNCVPICTKRDFSVYCESTTGKGFKCCPVDSVCDYHGGVVNCRNI